MFGIGRKKRVAVPAAGPRKPAPPPLLARTGRFALLVFAVTAAFGAVAFRLWWLHVYAAGDLRTEAELSRRSFRLLNAARGRILDCRDGVLASSHEVWDVGVDPNHFTPEQEAHLDDIADRLSKIIGVPSRKLTAVFERKFRDTAASDADATPAGSPDAPAEDSGDSPEKQASADMESGEVIGDRVRKINWVKLASGVDVKTRDAVAALRVNAIRTDRRFEREYPRKQLAAHLVGFMNKSGIPTMGVEKAFDFYLKGEDGWIDSRQNGKKREMVDRRIREIPPADGQDVELTIDSFIQQACEDELAKVADAYHPLGATVIVSEAKTGKLLALANWPTFDLNDYNDPKKAPLEAQKNRAVTDVFEPGSVFKIVSYSAAIQEGLITPNSLVQCGTKGVPFYVPYKGMMMKLSDDDETLGETDMRHAIWKSSNRAAAQVGMKVAEVKGEERYYKYIRDFGYGAPTGLVTGTEVRGRVAKPADWDRSNVGTITRMPMGHAVNVTALQVHYAMGVLAARGDLLVPMLVNRIVARDGKSAREFEPVVRKKGVISAETAATVTDMLRGVVSREGTAKLAVIPGYDVAGKTGTTMKLVKNATTGKLEYSNAHHVATFSGFFPASNPRIVITVSIDDPSGKGTAFGGLYSAPVFKDIAEKIIRLQEIPPVNPAAAAAALDKDRKKAGLPPIAPARPPGALVLDPF